MTWLKGFVYGSGRGSVVWLEAERGTVGSLEWTTLRINGASGQYVTCNLEITARRARHDSGGWGVACVQCEPVRTYRMWIAETRPRTMTRYGCALEPGHSSMWNNIPATRSCVGAVPDRSSGRGNHT